MGIRKFGRGFGKNAGGWTGKVEISKEEIPGSSRSMHGNINQKKPGVIQRRKHGSTFRIEAFDKVGDPLLVS